MSTDRLSPPRIATVPNASWDQPDKAILQVAGSREPPSRTLGKPGRRLFLRPVAAPWERRRVTEAGLDDSRATSRRPSGLRPEHRRRAHAGLYGRRGGEQEHPGRHLRSARGDPPRQGLERRLGTTITRASRPWSSRPRGIEDIYELTYIRKDGSRFPAIVSVTAVRDAQGRIIGYLLIGTDNTAPSKWKPSGCCSISACATSSSTQGRSLNIIYIFLYKLIIDESSPT